jgi:hypothetical protein
MQIPKTTTTDVVSNFVHPFKTIIYIHYILIPLVREVRGCFCWQPLAEAFFKLLLDLWLVHAWLTDTTRAKGKTLIVCLYGYNLQ